MSTINAPHSGVVYMSLLHAAKRSKVAGAGCPYMLFFPQDIIDTSGVTRLRNSVVEPYFEP
jgi:hypothetical protein